MNLKKILTISLLFVVCMFCACDKDATVAKIEGEFLLSDSLEIVDIVGAPVYLHTAMGNSPMGIVDSAFTTQELTFSFNDVPFGFYMLSIGSDLQLDPATIVIELDVDHSCEELEFTVSQKVE